MARDCNNALKSWAVMDLEPNFRDLTRLRIPHRQDARLMTAVSRSVALAKCWLWCWLAVTGWTNQSLGSFKYPLVGKLFTRIRKSDPGRFFHDQHFLDQSLLEPGNWKKSAALVGGVSWELYSRFRWCENSLGGVDQNPWTAAKGSNAWKSWFGDFVQWAHEGTMRPSSKTKNWNAA